MRNPSRSLIPAATVPPGTHLPVQRSFDWQQEVRIRATIRGCPSELDPRDREKVIEIVLRFKNELNLAKGKFLEDHVIAFLEFEYSAGGHDAWEMYKANFIEVNAAGGYYAMDLS